MTLRVATFNVENLFTRAAALNLASWADGRPILDDIEELNRLLAQDDYDAAAKAQIKAILDKYEFGDRNKTNRPFGINEVRDKLFKVPAGTKKVEIVATGRDDWVGWVELARDKISGEAVANTGRVIDAVNPDIACLVEVENRMALGRFNEQVLGEEFQKSFAFDLLVDGNDPRGIDLAILSRHPVSTVRPHIHDGAPSRIFSRDCPEYEILLPSGESLWVLANHFKSKGYGAPAESNAKRARQAARAAEIYQDALTRSDYVIVSGDLNDRPDSVPLKALVQDTDLRDVMTHPSYPGAPGTYETGNSLNQKIDYILLSPALWAKVENVAVERRGVWAPHTFPSFPEVTSSVTQASDHAAVWVDLDL